MSSALLEAVAAGATISTSGSARIKCLEDPGEPQAKMIDKKNSKTTNKVQPTLTTKLATVALLLLCLCRSHCVALVQVPNRHTVASIPGDLVLGILVPVHERPSPKQAQTRTCGSVREQYGIQRVEAAFRTIDSINSDPNILPNITLGIEIRDSCWHSPIALEQSIEFIRDAMAASEQTSPVGGGGGGGSGGARPAAAPTPSDPAQLSQQQQLIGNNSICAPLLKQQQQVQAKKVKNLVGVVGPASSTDTVQVQNLLQLFNMPQVGYSATSRDLSNKNFFKYFLRVVPSDKLQAQVLIDLMLAHNWTYITVAYTEGSYGSSLMNAFRERAQEAGICFATLESMPPNADDTKFDELIEAIQKHPNARVVICMCEGRTVGRLFAAFKRQHISNEYLVVGSDGWADRFDVVERQEEIALGGISIRIHSAYVHDFDDYYFALNPFTNQRNPWFAEFWETRFQCNLPEFPPGPSGNSGAGNNQISAFPANQQQQQPLQRSTNFIRPAGSRVYNRTCTGKESLRQNHKQDAKMAFVQKSIITMALGLDSMQRSICKKVGLCAEMLPINGSLLLQHLMNVRFSFLDEEVYFDEHGDPPGKYEILNFRRRTGTTTAKWTPKGPNGSDSDLADKDAVPDYSTASANEQQERKEAGNYHSYATLRVPRPPAPDSTPVDPMHLIDRQRRKRQSQRQAPKSGDANPQQQDSYSPTSDFEYVRVGSWKSSDGLSLFGDIHWPIRSTLDAHLAPGGSVGGGKPPPGTLANNSFRWSATPDRTDGRQQQQHQGQLDGDGLYPTPIVTTPLADWSDGNNLEPTATSVFETKQLDENDYANSNNNSANGNELHGGSALATMMTQVGGPPPKSVCSLPCAKGHAKKIQSDSVKCCWVCVPCRPREYLFNEFKCKACEKGWWPNVHQTGCDQITIEHLDWQTMEALAAISIACFGLLLTLATGLVFIRHNDTPVVKSTTRELSYMILFAMLLCYVNTFFLIARPTRETCFVTRILPGFSFAMMYGALVTKTNRIARILAGSKKKIITRRPYFMSATAQVAITWLIVLIECLIIIAVLVREPADKMLDYPSDERVVLVCNTTTVGIIAPLGFDFFLIAMCTLYAFKTRNVPENFNEAKFIGFTMYTTLVIWVAFVAIYLSSDHKVITLCLCISFSALFALFLLFLPRCYIILFKPEKNNRSYFTTTKNVRCHIGYQTGQGTAAAPAAMTAQQSSSSNSADQKPQQQQQQQVDYCWCGSPDCLLATSANLDNNNNGPEKQRAAAAEEQVRKGDNCFHWRPNKTLNSSSTANANAAEKQHRRLTPARVAPTNINNWPAQFEGPNQLGQLAVADCSAPFVISTALEANGKREQRQDSAGSNPNSGDHSSLAHQLFSSIWSAFARRSRRKESDKATSIQQHLRAIRHAENLDRQTHFRRSQVQRLVQRFDSTPTKEALGTNSFHRKQQHLFISQHPNQSISLGSCNQFGQLFNQLTDFNEQNCDWKNLAPSLKFQLITRGDQAERFLIALSQLVGCEQFWRLTNILSKYCATRQPGQPAIGQKTVDGDGGDEQEEESDQYERRDSLLPLDLAHLADRHFALAWLRFFIQLAHKSIESIQSLDYHHHRTATFRANQRQVNSSIVRPPTRVASLTTTTSASNGQRRPPEPTDQPLFQSNCCASQTGSISVGPTNTNEGRPPPSFDLNNEKEGNLGDSRPMSEEDKELEDQCQLIDSNAERATAATEKSNCDESQEFEFEDPIKRALECITGRSLSHGVQPHRHHREHRTREHKRGSLLLADKSRESLFKVKVEDQQQQQLDGRAPVSLEPNTNGTGQVDENWKLPRGGGGGCGNKKKKRCHLCSNVNSTTMERQQVNNKRKCDKMSANAPAWDRQQQSHHDHQHQMKRCVCDASSASSTGKTNAIAADYSAPADRLGGANSGAPTTQLGPQSNERAPAPRANKQKGAAPVVSNDPDDHEPESRISGTTTTTTTNNNSNNNANCSARGQDRSRPPSSQLMAGQQRPSGGAPGIDCNFVVPDETDSGENLMSQTNKLEFTDDNCDSPTAGPPKMTSQLNVGDGFLTRLADDEFHAFRQQPASFIALGATASSNGQQQRAEEDEHLGAGKIRSLGGDNLEANDDNNNNLDANYCSKSNSRTNGCSSRCYCCCCVSGGGGSQATATRVDRIANLSKSNGNLDHNSTQQQRPLSSRPPQHHHSRHKHRHHQHTCRFPKSSASSSTSHLADSTANAAGSCCCHRKCR